MVDHRQKLQQLFPQVKENYPRLAAIFTVEDPVLREKLVNAYLDEVQNNKQDELVATRAVGGGRN